MAIEFLGFPFKAESEKYPGAVGNIYSSTDEQVAQVQEIGGVHRISMVKFRNELARDIVTRINNHDPMRLALLKAANQFREYERLHLAKLTEDGDRKAAVNAGMALMCEKALKGI